MTDQPIAKEQKGMNYMELQTIQTRYDRKNEQWDISFGLTPVTAMQLLRRDLPDIPQWMCWHMVPEPAERALRAFLGDGYTTSGSIGAWRWERVPCSYGDVGLWSGSLKRMHIGIGWVGLIRVSGPENASFYMFSYFGVDMKINHEYLVSTTDVKLLRGFADDVLKAIRPKRSRTHVHVNVIGCQPNFSLKVKEIEPVYLPKSLYGDILAQVDGFFGNRKVYKKMDLPFKRGFLFTGMPGTGKTMLIRNLIRHCHQKYRVDTSYLAVHRRTDASDLRHLFSSGSDQRPALLILEDIESLCHETQLTRSEVLAELDGLQRASGMLLIATANDPSRIDPALLHRPSRFDRVWTFTPPDKALRNRYILDTFTGIQPAAVEEIAEGTDGWTFAYIKELRITAGLIAIREGRKSIRESDVRSALGLLRKQYLKGKNGHMDSDNPDRKVGFDAIGQMDDQEDMEWVA